MVHCHVPSSIKIFLVNFCTKYKAKQLNKSLKAKCLVSLDMIDMKMWTSAYLLQTFALGTVGEKKSMLILTLNYHIESYGSLSVQKRLFLVFFFWYKVTNGVKNIKMHSLKDHFLFT